MGTAEYTIATLRIEARRMQTELDDLRCQVREMVPRKDLEGDEHTIVELRAENYQLRTDICRLQAELDAMRHRLQEVWRRLRAPVLAAHVGIQVMDLVHPARFHRAHSSMQARPACCRMCGRQ
jgi:hypothetical protein